MSRHRPVPAAESRRHQIEKSLQNKGEFEQDFGRRLKDVVGRCGHVHKSDEITTLFTEGLNSEIRSLIQAYHDDHRNTTYLDLIQQARYEGNAVLA